MRPKLAVLFFALTLVGCASCPASEPDAPRLVPKAPVVVTARVDSFHDLGAFVDFPSLFVSYHSVVLVTEGSVGWKSISIQFQGLPMLGGKRLELGQRLRFTLPATKEGDCCKPYLADITDAEFLPPKGG
jgi:hypothetical protein